MTRQRAKRTLEKLFQDSFVSKQSLEFALDSAEFELLYALDFFDGVTLDNRFLVVESVPISAMCHFCKHS